MQAGSFHKLVPASGVAQTPRAAAALYNHITAQAGLVGILATAFQKASVTVVGISETVDILMASPETGAVIVAVLAGDVTYDPLQDAWCSEGKPLDADPCPRLLAMVNACAHQVRPFLCLPQSFTSDGLPVPAGITVLCGMPGLSDFRTTGDVSDDWLLCWNALLPSLAISRDSLPVVEPDRVHLSEAPSAPLAEDNPLVQVLANAVETMVAGRRVTMSGIDILPSEVVSPSWLLPTLTVATALNWRPVVAGRSGRGGFHVTLRSCRPEEAPCGFLVTELATSSPSLLVIPALESFRRCCVENVFDVDILMDRFRGWLKRHDIDTEHVDLLLTEFDMAREAA